MVGLGIQLEKMSRSFEMGVSFSWWMAVGEFLIAQKRKLSAWTMRSPSLIEGVGMYLCSNSMISENRSALVAPSMTWKQRECLSAGPMLNPLRPQKFHFFRMPGLVWMMMGHPIGPSGVASKLNGPWRCPHAEIYWVRVDCCRRLKVSSVCGRRWSHR